MASVYEQMTNEELDEQIAQLEAEAEKLRARGLKLDMARGKPSRSTCLAPCSTCSPHPPTSSMRV